MSAEHRLAVYGSLAPGKENHHQMAGMAGDWSKGTVRGRLHQVGWGASQGYPGLELDPAGDTVAVEVFTSTDLPAHWGRLDRFEGADYRRTLVTVETEAGPLKAYIYSVRP